MKCDKNTANFNLCSYLVSRVVNIWPRLQPDCAGQGCSPYPKVHLSLVGSDQPPFSEMGQREIKVHRPVQPLAYQTNYISSQASTSSASVKVDDHSSAGIATSQCRCIALNLTVSADIRHHGYCNYRRLILWMKGLISSSILGLLDLKPIFTNVSVNNGT